MTNKKINLSEIEKRVNKLTTRLWASIFVLLVLILAGGFFVFSSINFNMVANALVNSYNKPSGSILTADEWNKLKDDFGKVTLFEQGFFNVPIAVEIPSSSGAKFCYLTFVDDDSPAGFCRVYYNSGKWYWQTGGGGGENQCGAMCVW